MRIAIAVVAALCAAFCFALGSLIQQGAARQTNAPALRFGLLAALAHQRQWLGGMAGNRLGVRNPGGSRSRSGRWRWSSRWSLLRSCSRCR